ncbi:U32 family peptidase [Falsihalocynthiibacter sp. S25ZX9]|uniref:U32 family peptidase n=1 Tax=Falsihalocynthiibacter sp. S25ZX9 TaxID=3240870 RepID=UPI00350EC576
MPPELPLESIATLAAAARELGVEIEVWGFGRIPLAISGRCYHARLHGRTKDNRQFACEDDPDGLPVQAREGQPFLAMNGVQTLSDSHACMALHAEALAQAGVSSLRLSPQTGDFGQICALFHDLTQGRISGDTLVKKLQAQNANLRLSDGFLRGARGADWSGASAF